MSKSNWFKISMGIPKPESIEECAMAQTVNGMRQAIYKASHESALIRHSMQVADFQGLSGEDRYTMLAYHALVSLEQTYQQLTNYAKRMPDPLAWQDEDLPKDPKS